jgi:hypothetical protein
MQYFATTGTGECLLKFLEDLDVSRLACEDRIAVCCADLPLHAAISPLSCVVSWLVMIVATRSSSFSLKLVLQCLLAVHERSRCTQTYMKEVKMRLVCNLCCSCLSQKYVIKGITIIMSIILNAHARTTTPNQCSLK